MMTPPSSPLHSDIPSDGTSTKTRQSTRLQRLTTQSLDQPWPTINVNPATGRGSSPHKEKFHSYLGVVARDKTPIVLFLFSVSNLIMLNDETFMTKNIKYSVGSIIGLS